MDNASLKICKWWRKRCREEELLAPRNSKPKISSTDDLLCPTSKVMKILELSDARRFLNLEEQRVESLIHKLKSDRSVVNHKALIELSYIQGTYLILMKKYHSAFRAFSFALSLMENEERNGSKISFTTECAAIKSNLERMKRWLDMETFRNNFTPPTSPLDQRLVVDKVCFGTIDYSQFLQNYSRKRKPLIFQNASQEMIQSHDWSLETLVSLISDKIVPLKVVRTYSQQWAKQEQAESIPFTQFITHHIMEMSEERSQKDKRYLVDWSIPQNCEELLQNFNIPIYFSYDLLQCAPIGYLYRDSWPSLFIGAAGTQSKLHIDSFGSHFWMLLISGRKRWVFYPAADVPLLYPSYDHSFDPVFAYDPFPSSEDASAPCSAPCADQSQEELLREECSLSKYATPFEAILEPGDLIFVPSGMPHAVMNLETSVAISGNFVDVSNIEDVKAQLRLDGLICDRSRDLYEYLNNHTVEDMEKKMEDIVNSNNDKNNIATSNDINHNENNNNAEYIDNNSLDTNNINDNKSKWKTIPWRKFKHTCNRMWEGSTL